MMWRAARSMRLFAHGADPAGLLQTRRLGPPLEKPDAMRLLIVWHSRTGMAKQMAEALYTGALKAMQDMEAAETDFAIDLLRAQDAQVSDLLSAHGFLFCAPENLASMSGEMKEFFDRCYYGALGRLNGRPFALAVCGGSDGEGAANQMARICRGWRLKNLAVPLILRSGAQTPEAVAAAKVLDTSGTEKCMDLGGLMAAHMLLGAFLGKFQDGLEMATGGSSTAGHSRAAKRSGALQGYWETFLRQVFHWPILLNAIRRSFAQAFLGGTPSIPARCPNQGTGGGSSSGTTGKFPSRNGHYRSDYIERK
ncbi:unnamed protein product, partial [Symbiodinium sp. CCMP2592]